MSLVFFVNVVRTSTVQRCGPTFYSRPTTGLMVRLTTFECRIRYSGYGRLFILNRRRSELVSMVSRFSSVMTPTTCD